MIRVTLSMTGERRMQILFAGVPRVGESIRLSNGLGSRTLVVEHVLWMEACDDGLEPDVILVVRERGRVKEEK